MEIDAIPGLDPGKTAVITYNARMPEAYVGGTTGGQPTASGDTYVNTATASATATPVPGAGTGAITVSDSDFAVWNGGDRRRPISPERFVHGGDGGGDRRCTE